MPAPCIYTTDQLAFIRRSYLSKRLPPREVAREVNEKFGTAYTKTQISSLASERGWTKRRKIARVKALDTMDTAALVKGHQRAELATAREIVDGHARLGAVITKKAESFARDATSAKTLSSAASAAKTGISITRDALGLNSSSAPAMHGGRYSLLDLHGPDSPFSPEGRERQRLAEMKRAEQVQESAPVEIVCVSVNAESMEAPSSEAK